MAASGLNLMLKERKNQIPDAGGKIPDLVSGQEKSVRAGSGTLTHPNRDKIFRKWVAIKDLGAFVAGFCTEFRCESF